MSDARDLDALDDRGRAAAAGIRAAVAERPVPELDLDVVRIGLADPVAGTGRRPAAVVLVGVAAAIALVVGLVAVLADRGDDRDSTADDLGTGSVGLYVLDPEPDVYSPRFVQVAGASSAPATGVPVYGPDRSDPRLAVGRFPDDEGTDVDSSESSSSEGSSSAEPGDGSATTVIGSGPVGESEVGSEGDVEGEVEGVVELPEVTAPEVDGDGDSSSSLTDGLPEVELDGRRAWDASAFLGTGGLLVAVDGDVVFVLGAGVDDDVRRRAAETVQVDGDRVTVPAEGLPSGWEQLGETGLDVVGLGTFGVMRGAGTTADRSTVLYVQPATDGAEFEGTLVVSAFPGDELTVGLPALTMAAEPVEVRGEPGVVARFDLGEDLVSWVLRWQERPGEVVELGLTGRDIGRDDLLALAGDLRRADSAERDELQRRVLRHGEGTPGVTLLGEGTFSDGSNWVLAHGADGTDVVGVELRTDARFGSDSAGVESVSSRPGAGEEPFLSGVSVGYGDPLWWSYGEVGPEVAAVEVVDPASGEVVAVATVVEAEGVRGYVVELPIDSVEVRAVDATGDVLQTYSFDR